MGIAEIVRTLGKQDWLDPLGDALQGVVTAAYEAAGPSGAGLKNVLHGTWLGHPLHPVLTDVPLGAWTGTVALDSLATITGRDDLTPGADAALALGLLAALPTAAAGWTDWQHTGGESRRVGVAHGVLNLGAVALFTVSLIQRLAGQRGAGRGYASLGYTMLLASAYLGGDLVYGRQIGVNHAAGQDGPSDFVAVLPESELRENEPRRVEVEGVPIVLVKSGGRIHALIETCSHLGGPLAEGEVRDGGIVCPWHGSRFALNDGRVLDGPAAYRQPSLETRVREGQIEVRGRP